MKRSGFKRKRTVPLKRTKLRVVGFSDTADVKKDIQALVREIVIKRDRGCIFRDNYYKLGLPPCNGYRKDGGMIYQADHLITRGNTDTFADTRLIVCLCKGHHGWKSVGSNLRKAQYDEIVRKILSPERVKLWDKSESDMWKTRTLGPKTDLKMELIALQQELKNI